MVPDAAKGATLWRPSCMSRFAQAPARHAGIVHGVIPERLQWLADDATAALLGQRFRDAGHQLFLVGGSVRDALMDRSGADADLDFTTDARPDEIRAIVDDLGSVYAVGEAYGTIGLHRDGRDFEITTFRSDVYRSESRKPEVTFGDTIEHDLERRDFTVNAMALQLPSLELVDPFDGRMDLAGRVLRTPADPERAFSDDPLRMMRLYRFVAQLGFGPAPDAVEAVRNMADRLEIVSAERIRDELSKMLVGENVVTGLKGLVESGLAAFVIPELPALRMEEDPSHRHKDVFAHTLAVVEKTSPRLRLRMAALLHDIGKPDTRAFVGGGVTFHHHEVVGARMARARLKALRYPKEFVSDVGQLVFLHLRPHTFKMGWTDSAVRRYVRDAGTLLDDLNELVRCDVTTANQKRASAIQRRIDELERRIEELAAKEELLSLRAPLDGNEVMELIELSPGPLVGEIMRLLLDRRIDDGPYDRDEAVDLVYAWAEDKGIARRNGPPED